MTMSGALQFLNQLFGLSEPVTSLNLYQVIMRAVLIYLAGYLILRVGSNRFVGRNTPYDIILGFIFGSTLSRAINSNSPLFVTIIAAVVLVFLHWLFVSAAYYSKIVNRVLNGKARVLIKDGVPQQRNLRRSKVSQALLEENMRLEAGVDALDQIGEAYMERSGKMSILPKPGQLKVLEVRVEEGVQTVRIEIS